MNQDLIKAAESGDIFLLYRRNIRYLKGQTNWTLQGKHLVYKLIATAFTGVFLGLFWYAGTIIGFTPDSSDPRILILLTAIFSPSFVLWIAYKIKKERDLARNGRLIRGRITSCEWTMGGEVTLTGSRSILFLRETSLPLKRHWTRTWRKRYREET